MHIDKYIVKLHILVTLELKFSRQKIYRESVFFKPLINVFTFMIQHTIMYMHVPKIKTIFTNEYSFLPRMAFYTMFK